MTGKPDTGWSKFDEFFKKATGHEHGPFPYQCRLALNDTLPALIDIPTGAGKTAAVILAWLWRRRFDEKFKDKTPRRLVYCLPMRVLVEQTRDNAIQWLNNVGMLAGKADKKNGMMEYDAIEKQKSVQDDTRSVDGFAKENGDSGNRIAVTVLMGGEDADEWDLYPERDAIIIGTQDMLLSRALNRGYGMSRYRWPMHFGLLNNDCLWVMDEVQLMGVGVETTFQLDAFRAYRWGAYGIPQSIWMSATLSKGLGQTVDRKAIEDCLKKMGKSLIDEPFPSKEEWEKTENDERFKPIRDAVKKVTIQKDAPVPEELLNRKPGTLSLVVLNTVHGARNLYASLDSKRETVATRPNVILLHSQFRPDDRKKQVEELLEFEKKRKENAQAKKDKKPEPHDLGNGLLVVSTQVVEAGVDISATMLWSEVSPWASIVQRLGRLNRDGLAKGAVANFWMPKMETKKENVGPYLKSEIEDAKEWLDKLEKDVRNNTPEFGKAIRDFSIDRKSESVIRPIDIYELFSTDPDLHGGFTDISRYIRAVERELTANVLWRDFDVKTKEDPSDFKAPSRKEICPVPFYMLAEFLKNFKSKSWLYSPDDSLRRWQSIAPADIRPGMTILLAKSSGGYIETVGWTGEAKDKPAVVYDGVDDDDLQSERSSIEYSWQTIPEHTGAVYDCLTKLTNALSLNAISDKEKDALLAAARWHDSGKAHPQWQGAIQPSTEKPPMPNKSPPWAKFVMASDTKFRPNLRHELVSALRLRREWLRDKTTGHSALAVYLAAAHHGKVRCELRSNLKPEAWDEEVLSVRNAFGVFEKDDKGKPVELPHTDLGNGITAPPFSLIGELECMEVGLIEKDGQEEPSWTQMVFDVVGPCEAGIVYPNVPTAEFRKGMLGEVHRLGPFRMAFLEALLRAADLRASAKERGP